MCLPVVTELDSVANVVFSFRPQQLNPFMIPPMLLPSDDDRCRHSPLGIGTAEHSFFGCVLSNGLGHLPLMRRAVICQHVVSCRRRHAFFPYGIGPGLQAFDQISVAFGLVIANDRHGFAAGKLGPDTAGLIAFIDGICDFREVHGSAVRDRIGRLDPQIAGPELSIAAKGHGLRAFIVQGPGRDGGAAAVRLILRIMGPAVAFVLTVDLFCYRIGPRKHVDLNALFSCHGRTVGYAGHSLSVRIPDNINCRESRLIRHSRLLDRNGRRLILQGIAADGDLDFRILQKVIVRIDSIPVLLHDERDIRFLGIIVDLHLRVVVHPDVPFRGLLAHGNIRLVRIIEHMAGVIVIHRHVLAAHMNGLDFGPVEQVLFAVKISLIVLVQSQEIIFPVFDLINDEVGPLHQAYDHQGIAVPDITQITFFTGILGHLRVLGPLDQISKGWGAVRSGSFLIRADLIIAVASVLVPAEAVVMADRIILGIVDETAVFIDDIVGPQ